MILFISIVFMIIFFYMLGALTDERKLKKSYQLYIQELEIKNVQLKSLINRIEYNYKNIHRLEIDKMITEIESDIEKDDL